MAKALHSSTDGRFAAGGAAASALNRGFAEAGPGFVSPSGAKSPLSLCVEAAFADTIAGRAVVIDPASLDDAWASRFSPDEISDLVVPKRTLARRIAQHEPLSPDETDRAIRVGRASIEAERVFANPSKAHLWLRLPNHALNEQRPIDLLRTDIGTQAVYDVLNRIDHGMFS